MKYAKLKLLIRVLWNGIVGIFFETALSLFFIFVGFMICVLWWGLVK